MRSNPALAPLLNRWEKRLALGDADRQAMLSLPCQLRNVSRDQYLVREGERPDHCSLIVKGFAYGQKVTGDGARQILTVHIPGEFVGLENSFLATCDHNVQVLAPGVVASVRRQALQDVLAAHPAIASAFWIDNLIQASIYREWLVNLGRRDAQARVAHVFCELLLRFTEAGLARGNSYEMPLTQAQLADVCGLTSVHINRVLRTLRQRGLIAMEGRQVDILDWNGLRSAGDFSELYLHREPAVMEAAPGFA